MISQEAAQRILGITEKVHLTPLEMADKLNITFYPFDPKKQSREVLAFREQLEGTFHELKVNVIPFPDALTVVPIWKVSKRILTIIVNDFLFAITRVFFSHLHIHRIPFAAILNTLHRRRIKKGIAVVVTGDHPDDELPMAYTSSFTESSIITIVDFPKHISDTSYFHEHFDTAMNLFAYHMTNIILAVDEKRWLLYNFNASHPIYPRTELVFKQHVLKGLIPKIAAPIRPHRFKDFNLIHEPFDIEDLQHRDSVYDLVQNSQLLGRTGLYPKGKTVSELPFRNDFYRWMGRIHLDSRNGMSYGFLARQMAIKVPRVLTLAEAKSRYTNSVDDSRDYFECAEGFFVILELPSSEKIVANVPPVWVLSQRSGSDKVRVNPSRDLIKIGINRGHLMLQTPKGLKLNRGYKPSFDTKVILANAIGNVLVAAVLKHLNPKDQFAETLEKSGLAICHWHGYFHPQHIPEGWHIHGNYNPHVACSSPQSALYALQGKLTSLLESLKNNTLFLGDIHIEPHHGTNITLPSIAYFSGLLQEKPDATVLGNRYLSYYNSDHV